MKYEMKYEIKVIQQQCSITANSYRSKLVINFRLADKMKIDVLTLIFVNLLLSVMNGNHLFWCAVDAK